MRVYEAMRVSSAYLASWRHTPPCFLCAKDCPTVDRTDFEDDSGQVYSLHVFCWYRIIDDPMQGLFKEVIE